MLPLPATIRSSVSYMRVVPTRQNVHLPQLSRWVKSRKYRAVSTLSLIHICHRTFYWAKIDEDAAAYRLTPWDS